MNKRKKRMIIIFTLAIFIIIAILIISVVKHENNLTDVKVGQTYTPRKENIRTDEATGIKFINNEIMIIFNPVNKVSKERKQEIINNINGKIVGIFDEDWDYIQVEVSEMSYDELKKFIKDLEKMEEVFGAMPDLVSEITDNANTNDPSDEKKWKERKLKSSNWWLSAIQANEAWDYNDRFNNIKIGIVDSGFDTGHEDLNINFATKTNEKVNNKNDHGTHVAGIIGATANNGKGVAGIVWNKELICYDWQPTWLQEKLGGWNTVQAILAGLIFNVKSGAKVVNFSCGNNTKVLQNGNNFSQQRINEEAYYYSSGIAALLVDGYDFVVVNASGNGDKNGLGVDAKNKGIFAGITAENCYTNSEISADDILNRIIVVANAEQTDNGYQIHKTSNCGNTVDICAPGQNIYSTITGEFLNVTQTKGSYGYLSGTSMAAPIVSSVASLVWSVNEKFTGAEVKEIVCNNYSQWIPCNPNSPHTKSNRLKTIDGKEINGYPMVNAKLSVEEAIRRTDVLVVPIEDETQSTEIVEIEEADNYEWHLEPTIEADNIIVPDYDNELYERYAIIEKNGKYGLISNKGEFIEDIKYNNILICNTQFNYGLTKENHTASVFAGESKDSILYIWKDDNLHKSYHGDHGLIPDYLYYYNINDNKTYVVSQIKGNCKEYKDDEVVLSQKASLNIHEDGTYSSETYNEYYLVNGNGKINNTVYDEGINSYSSLMQSHKIIYAKKDNKYFYFNNKGEQIIFEDIKKSYMSPAGITNSSDIKNGRCPFLDVDNVIAVNTKDGGCFYDINGDKLTDIKDFEEVRPMINGFAWVKKDGKWGVIKFDDKIIAENNIDIEITKQMILESVNNYLSQKWNGENNFYIFADDIVKKDDCWIVLDIRWNGSENEANTVTFYSCKIDKNTGIVQIYRIGQEKNIKESFNLYDYYTLHENNSDIGTVKIEDGYLNVRETPSTKGKIIGKLYNGDKITIEETSEDGKWLKITKGEIKGYVSKEFVNAKE